MKQEPTRLFVYGTLRKDHAHDLFHLLAKHARFLGLGKVPGRLFDLGEYPGMVTNGGSSRVHGEVYEVEPQKWQLLINKLDKYEGCSPEDPEPHEYTRRLVNARLQDGRHLKTWAYVLNKPVAGLPEIKSGDYLDWQASRRSAKRA